MTPPVVVIANPRSTGATTHETLSKMLEENGIEAKIAWLAKDADVTALARNFLKEGFRTLVAAGGDGTVRAVAAALVDTDATLGVLPLGGLNHFARDLGLPVGLADAIQLLKSGTARLIDAAEVNGVVFVNNSGLGLYPSLVVQREKRRKRGRRKWIAFLQAALATLRRFPFLDVRFAAEGQAFERRTPFVFIGNNEYRMEGFHLGSRTSLTGANLCLAVAQYRIGRIGLLRLAFRALLGRIHNERDFDIIQAKAIHIGSRHRRLPVSLDGEVLALDTPLRYKALPSALRVIAP